jgi:tRNA-Thr(GGU) m(6)t(6)A37 methyltransferase TsaA
MSTFPKDFVVLKSIGTIHTPYTNKAPNQSVEESEGEFKIILNKSFTEGLFRLDTFKYIYVIYYLDRVIKKNEMLVTPPMMHSGEVGLFSSRSPNRPNPIGISVVRIKEIFNNIIYISGIDAFDRTPVLDIKPYFDELDSKADAGTGWFDRKDDSDHFILHLKGIPHKH